MNVETKESSLQEEPEMTPEEILARRKELIKFYKDEIPLLKSRSEYEKYLTNIEEARFARFQIRIAHAQMLAPQEGSEDSEARMKKEFAKSNLSKKLKTN